MFTRITRDISCAHGFKHCLRGNYAFFADDSVDVAVWGDVESGIAYV